MGQMMESREHLIVEDRCEETGDKMSVSRRADRTCRPTIILILTIVLLASQSCVILFVIGVKRDMSIVESKVEQCRRDLSTVEDAFATPLVDQQEGAGDPPIKRADMDMLLSRQKRDAITVTARPASMSERTIGQGSTSNDVAMHFYPHRHENHDELMSEATRDDGPRVKCGRLTQFGLKYDCEDSNYWVPDHHSQSSPIGHMVEGHLVIHQPGLYYVYSQITHHDPLGTWSYGIYRRDSSREEHAIAHCPGMEPHYYYSHNTRKVYPVQFQCHTSRVVYLHLDDEVFIKHMYWEHANRVIKMDRHLSFWGLFKLDR